MMAAQEAGLTIDDFGELPAEQCDWWMRYVVEGPSGFRQQILLASLVRHVSAYTQKKPTTIEEQLPYLQILASKQKGRISQKEFESRLERDREYATSLMQDMIESVKRERANGTGG